MFDSPLTKDGIIQAIEAGKKMQDEYQHCSIGNTRFCCSPLTRTFDTVIVIMYSALYQRDENDHLKSLLNKIFENRLNLLNTRYNSRDMNSKIASKCEPKTLKWKYTPAMCNIDCQNKWWNIDDDLMTMNRIINEFIKPSINNGNNGNNV
jgi:bisphosphoglycerate-dependent phosphoglycerate mutase